MSESNISKSNNKNIDAKKKNNQVFNFLFFIHI